MTNLVDLKEDEIIVNFNKKFYNEEAIIEALIDFEDVSEWNIGNDDEDTMEIKLKPKDKKIISVLGYEFCNYVLGLMKNKSLV